MPDRSQSPFSIDKRGQTVCTLSESMTSWTGQITSAGYATLSAVADFIMLRQASSDVEWIGAYPNLGNSAPFHAQGAYSLCDVQETLITDDVRKILDESWKCPNF